MFYKKYRDIALYIFQTEYTFIIECYKNKCSHNRK